MVQYYMIELQILKLLCNNRLVFNKYYQYIDMVFLKKTYPLIYKLFTVVSVYYSKYESADSLSSEDLESMYLVSYPVTKEVQREELEAVMTRYRSTPESNSEVILELLKQHKVRAVAQEIAVAALDVAEGRNDQTVLLEKFQALQEETDNSAVEDMTAITSNLDALYEQNVQQQGLRWPLPFLNKSLGSLRKGDFGFVFARPETGKTTFLAHICTHMAGQIEDGGPVLWFNNEEQGEKVMLRCHQAANGLTTAELFDDRAERMRQYVEKTGDNIRIFDEPSLTASRAEQIIKGLKPSLIIFDQIDKLSGFGGDRRDLEMGKIYRWAREMAKKYAPVIGICQADGSGEGVRYLTMSNVADAKTAKQAEADWILGIGKSHDQGFSNVRFFNISKNKLIGDEDSVPEMRHGSAVVVIEPTIAQYKEMTRED